MMVWCNEINSCFVFCIVDPLGAQERIIELANRMGINVSVAVAYEANFDISGIFCGVSMKLKIVKFFYWVSE